MKKSILLFLFLGSISNILQAQFQSSSAIEEPYYELQTQGIRTITKIERNEEVTKLHIRLTFVPGGWVSFNEKEYIEDSDSGEKYTITAIEGSKFNEHIVIPESGESFVTLIFPPLDNNVENINFGKFIYGISLDKKMAGKKKVSTVPDTVMEWINNEIDKNSNKKSIFSEDSNIYFKNGKARLIGYIKGYDERLDFNTGIIYIDNEIKNLEFPIVVHIYKDGRFEADIPLIHPLYTSVIINEQTLSVYLEPNQTTAMIVDWDEFLKATTYGRPNYQFKEIHYKGALAQINKELMTYEYPKMNYKLFTEKTKSLEPSEFKTYFTNRWHQELEKFQKHESSVNLLPTSKNIIKNRIDLETIDIFFNFIRTRQYEASQDSTNTKVKVPEEITFYDFLNKLPLNDPRFLTNSEGFHFLNMLEFSKPLFENIQRKLQKPEKTLLDYFNDEKIQLTHSERELLEDQPDFFDDKKKAIAYYQKNKEIYDAFNIKYKKENEAYSQKYLLPALDSRKLASELDIWKRKDSIMEHHLKLGQNLMYDIIKVRSLDFNTKKMTKEEVYKFWSGLKKNIREPFLIAQGNALLKERFPENESVSQTLPKGRSTDIFNKIMEPYKGKIVFVDFWATSCGPCVGTIKNMQDIRTKYKNNSEFDFVFITDERQSPEKTYHKFVEEQELEHIHRIPTDDYNQLRELFKFNGIPKYVVIDWDGKVLDWDFAMYNFENELEKILASSSKPTKD